jgi:transposase
VAIAAIVARVIEPRSKLATARDIAEETASSSLGVELGLEGISEDHIYKAMDWLLARQGRIEDKIAARHLKDGSLLLYDVSSSYYTGRRCPLAFFGHNHAGKKGFPQIVYGLLCNADGCPIAVEVFKGNTADTKTLSSQIEKVRSRFGIKRVIFVGDRGMITTKRIEEEFRGVEGLDWITALRSEAIKRLAEQKVIELSLFDERDMAEVTSPEYPGERLIVCRNPLLAQERARTREELLKATEAELEKIAAGTRREKRPLRGSAAIGLRVGKVINRYKMSKHFVRDITDTSFSYRRDERSIAEEAALDGFYVLRTSVNEEVLSAQSTVRAYKDLAKVERAFRCLKSIDLKVHPINHRLEDRVRAHVFLCMLAYYVEWHMRGKLAPLLFDDEEKALAESLRNSIVAPAQRSPSAKRKERTKRTAAGMPVHSFHTLLDDLRTLAKNRVRIAEHDEFYMLTEPTKLQAQAFKLLGVPLSL